MTDKIKSEEVVKAELEISGAIKDLEKQKEGFLARLSDDLLEDVNGGSVHLNGHGNVVVT
ncbi:hypothetical protein [Pseudoduganella sp. HUAS MS19]|jgi:hypothetical protein